MKEIICECGHGINVHTETGCWFEVDYCLYCECTKTKEDLYRERATTAERERDELAAQLATAQADNVRMTTLAGVFETERDLVIEKLATAQAERDSAQRFLARIIEHCDDNGVMQDGKAINLTAARKAAGIQEP